uniref:DUF868 domain-containing protein n=1 Tax=Ananas comosus var. bracteatus TaxID=296719 RepID=A0A6V7QX20_ANACO
MAGKARKAHLGSHLPLLAPAMKDFASCFSDHAVRVSDVACSGASSTGASAALVEARSVRSAVTALYRARLSTRKEVLVAVAWCRGHDGAALSVGVGAAPRHALRKKKGAERSPPESATSTSSGTSPPPSTGRARAHGRLLPGGPRRPGVRAPARDSCGDFVKTFDGGTRPAAEFAMVSRREKVVGPAAYSTRARFRGDGREHEITITCRGAGEAASSDADADAGAGAGAKESELAVCVDKKRVVCVKRLRWNFRGNQTIFVEGSPVDMMWDVHDWWFGGEKSSADPSGQAVFMFRTRSALDSRLWLEDDDDHDDDHDEALSKDKEQRCSGFSLLIQAFKSP